MRIEKSFFLFPSFYFSAFLPLRPPFLFRVYLPFRSYLFSFCPLLLIFFLFNRNAHCLLMSVFIKKITPLLFLFLPLKRLKRVPFSSYFHFFYPSIRHLLLLQKDCVFAFSCCDNLIKWNVKCVIFRVRKRGEKGEETLQYC